MKYELAGVLGCWGPLKEFEISGGVISPLTQSVEQEQFCSTLMIAEGKLAPALKHFVYPTVQIDHFICVFVKSIFFPNFY